MTGPSPLPAPPRDLLVGASLFLDFDGTLVTLADRPEAVEVPDGLHPLLERLGDMLDGRMAIVSGRDVDTLRGRFGLATVPIAGSHGSEISLEPGTIDRPEAPETLIVAGRAFDAIAATDDGLLVERKPLGVCLHYRRAPEREADCRRVAGELAQMHGLHLQDGKMMAELRAGDDHKGSAIRALMQRDPFGGGAPVFLGDDVTDEDGFEAVRDLGGHGILIGEERETAAQYRLADVAAVHHWLEQGIPQ
ncbi:trehalose-phosphatase [Novosphingopyxis iocasae]|uniref:trehalose-phosphatase n=1 Tax=Novosphingopyxis iocasae TaxID=2762729 RepID=UPI00165184F2|nr:trehalose-phosphatase [Novosphingopyxis iocasae]